MNIFILNDTRTDRHHGCEIVMQNLIRGLSERGTRVIGTLGWSRILEKNPRLASMANKADAIIINGEGTIHHDQPYARYLLETGSALAQQGKAVYLVNSTWQENSPQLVELIKNFKGVWVRDQASAKELAEHGVHAGVAPDLTFFSAYEDIRLPDASRSAIIVSDSVFAELSKTLSVLAKLKNWKYLPVIKRPNPRETAKQRERWVKSYLYAIAEKVTLGAFKPRQYYIDIRHCITDTALYIEELRKSQVIISARYHVCCLAIQNRIPFLFLTSNTRKIENLLSDIGISHITRGITTQDLLGKDSQDIIKAASHSTQDKQNIAHFLTKARTQLNTMFDHITAPP